MKDNFSLKECLSKEGKMKKRDCLIAMLLFCLGSFQFSYAQPETVWTKTFGGDAGDWGHDVQQTSDGGYIITAQGNFNHWDYAEGWLIKTDANGNVQWFKTDTTNGYISAQQTTDGGYIILGAYLSFDVGTYTNYDVSLLKTDVNGRTLWTKTYGGGEAGEYCTSVHQTTDGGYIITGSTDPFSDVKSDVLLVKTDVNGNVVFTKNHGGDRDDQGRTVQQTSDGGYIIIGDTHSSELDSDIWLIKTDADGDIIWTNTFGGSARDEGHDVQQTSDGGYIIIGDTYSSELDSDIWLIKTDANGETMWSQTFGGNYSDWGHSVRQTNDVGYIITGTTNLMVNVDVNNSDLWIIKTDANGEIVWSQTFGGSYFEYGSSIRQTTDGGYIIIGATESFGVGDSDIWLIKLAGPTAIHENPYTVIKNYHLLQNYPNPFNPSTTIRYSIPKSSKVTLAIYDLLGREITTLVNETQTPGEYSVIWNGQGYPGGIYICHLKAGDFTETRKLVLQK
jgi:hypothetical protein